MSQVYEVFTKLSMIDNTSGALATVAKNVLHVDQALSKLQNTLTTVNRVSVAVAGGLAAIGGYTVLSGLAKITQHGDKLLDQQDKLQRAGMSLNEVLKLQGDYYERVAKSVPTSTAAEYLKTFNELRSVVGADKAAEKTPWAMKLESIISNSTGKSAEGEAFRLFRALEMKGITLSDPAMSEKLADAMVKNIIGSGGKLDARTFELLAKRGGVAWAKASPRFIAGPLSNVASDLGGDTAGTALMSLYQFSSGATVLSRQQAEVLMKSKMLDMSKVQQIEGSDKLKIGPGAMLGWQLAQTDADLWVQQMLAPHMRAAYGDDISAPLAKLGRNRNVTRMLTMFSDPGFIEQQAKDAAMWAQAHSADRSYSDFISRNPKGVRAAFDKQYESMMQAIGAPLMQAAIPVMKAVTDMFTKLGAFANANPEAIKAVGVSLASVSALMVGAGAAALIGAAAAFIPGGVVSLALAGLAAGLGTLAAVKWSSITAGLDYVSQKLNAFLEAMRSWGERFGAWLNSLIAKLGSFLGISLGGGGGGSYADSAARMRAMGATGASNLPLMARGGGGDIVSLGKSLQAQGLRVSEHRAFGGVHPVHHGLGHYQGRAIDVNFGHGVNEASNPAIGSRFDALASALRGKGYKVIWRAPGHYNHMHVEAPRGGRVNFSPPSRRSGQMLQVNSSVNLDGRELARATSHHIAKLHEHSRQAPYFNGRGMFSGPDSHFAVG